CFLLLDDFADGPVLALTQLRSCRFAFAEAIAELTQPFGPAQSARVIGAKELELAVDLGCHTSLLTPSSAAAGCRRSTSCNWRRVGRGYRRCSCQGQARQGRSRPRDRGWQHSTGLWPDSAEGR